MGIGRLVYVSRYESSLWRYRSSRVGMSLVYGGIGCLLPVMCSMLACRTGMMHAGSHVQVSSRVQAVM